MRADVLTKEYPPEIYGGAGVHVAELVKALRTHIEVQVRCFGAPRAEPDATAYQVPAEFVHADGTLQTIAVDLQMANDVAGADIAHSHTWYANEAGRRAQQLHGIPHVITAHSLEPLRPWKAEQLGGGYAVSLDIERRAYESADRVIAVSEGMRRDILRCYPAIAPERVVTIHNGIDLDAWHTVDDPNFLQSRGINPDARTLVFVGRITRQKGLPYLLRAARMLPADVQLVLCAGAPDTPEIANEVTGLVDELQRERSGVIWIGEHLQREHICALLSAATAFVCPSIYEPLGIVNLEAMACGLPVIGTATGGIPEVVVDGETGWLVPIEQLQDGTGTPVNPDAYLRDLAAAMTEAVSDLGRAKAFGAAGRSRAAAQFSWQRIAEQTRQVYSQVCAER